MRKAEQNHEPSLEQNTNKMVEHHTPKQARTAAIRSLNDQLRRYGTGGSIYTTDGIAALGGPFLTLLLGEIACFEDFSPDNDPHGEHDCAAMIVRGHSIIWKIDYYDSRCQYHSADAADPSVTVRVLTVMRVDEY